MSRTVEFLYLQQEEVIQCGGLDMDAYIAGAEKAFTLLEKGDCIERESPLIQWAPNASASCMDAFKPVQWETPMFLTSISLSASIVFSTCSFFFGKRWVPPMTV